jgi:hypothetical protein
MDSVALSNEEQAYFETGGEKLPSVVTEVPQTVTEEPVIETATNEESTQEQPPRDEKGKFVPHQALHAEREEHKKTKSQLEEIARKQAVLEDRWNTLLKLKEEPQAPAGPPDPNEDLFGYMKWQGEQLKSVENKLSERDKAEELSKQEREQEQQITTYWQTSVTDYANRVPEFTDAANWLSEYRHKQLQALSPIDPRMANPAVRNAQIDAELKQIITVAAQNNQNPAELVHQLAKGWGFAPKAADTTTVTLPDKLANIDAAQQASRTLAASGGKTGADPLSAEAIISMSNEEFAKWSADPANAKRLNKMLGA